MAHQRLAAGHALLLPAADAAQHLVAHHRVGAHLQAQHVQGEFHLQAVPPAKRLREGPGEGRQETVVSRDIQTCFSILLPRAARSGSGTLLSCALLQEPGNHPPCKLQPTLAFMNASSSGSTVMFISASRLCSSDSSSEDSRWGMQHKAVGGLASRTGACTDQQSCQRYAAAPPHAHRARSCGSGTRPQTQTSRARSARLRFMFRRSGLVSRSLLAALLEAAHLPGKPAGHAAGC